MVTGDGSLGGFTRSAQSGSEATAANGSLVAKQGRTTEVELLLAGLLQLAGMVGLLPFLMPSGPGGTIVPVLFFWVHLTF